MPVPSHATPVERFTFWAVRIFVAAVLLFLLAPLLAIMPLSFNSEPYFSYPLPGLSLRWYHELFFTDRWLLAIKNSIIIASATTMMATTLGTLAALGLTMTRVPGHKLIMSVLISPLIVPVIISAVGMFFFFAQVGLTATYLGVILAHTVLATPFVIITVTATLSGFDRNLLRAGASLGAHPSRVFFKVTLPLILPGVISGALFAFATSFDEVVVVLFVGSPEQRTLPRVMFSGIRETISPTITAAATVLTILSTLLLASLELLRRRNQRLRGIRE